jgi:predicted short-subunit dehydrogenase-like oxidoreductase (DUF2520 family)
MEINRIAIIGTGNVASNLAIAMYKCNLRISYIIGRNIESASKIAKKVHSNYSDNYTKAVADSDIVFFCVKDDALTDILKKTTWENKLLIHTSGSQDIDVFKRFTTNFGVFYPVQTFSKKRIVAFKQIPICVEANNKKNLKKIRTIADALSSKVYNINSLQRLKLHIAAVFACNFTNHMLHISSEILKKETIPFDILLPLIQETIRKAMIISPETAQTGPAVRNDATIIEKHVIALKEHESFQKLYSFVTESIQSINNSSK